MTDSLVISRRAVAFGAPLIVVGAAFSARAQSSQSYVARVLSAAEAQADIALMRRALETIHPGLYRRTSQRALDRSFQVLARLAAAPVSELDLYRGIAGVLADIRCSHTKAEQPPQFEAWRNENASHLPFRFRLIEGRMIVVSAKADTGLSRGAEILAINGRAISELARTLGRYVAIDGETVWSRATNLADDSDLMGSDFDHYYPYVHGVADTFTLRVRDRDGAPAREISVVSARFQDWLLLENEGRRFRANFSDTTTWRMADARTGYLRVQTFVNYRRPTDAQALFTRAMNELREAGAARLIVDLRDNGGGSDDAALALLDHLVAAPYTFQRAIRLRAIRFGDLPDFIQIWGDRDALFNPPVENFVQTADGWFDRRAEDYPHLLRPRGPAAAAFTGPVTVLTSPVNASGATMTIAKLRDEGRARLVGERCGGSGDGPTAGQIFNVGLPASGIKVRIPLALNLMNVRRFDRDGGIRPDVRVDETVEDFRSGRDRAMEVALAG